MRAFGPGTRAKRWSVLGELCQEIEWREDLEIPFRACSEVGGLRIGKSPAIILFGLIDNFPCLSYLDQPTTIAARRCPTEWAANHVLYQALDPFLVPSLQKHGLVDTKTTMFPRMHILHNFRFDLALGQVKGKHGFLPGQQQTVYIKFRQF